MHTHAVKLLVFVAVMVGAQVEAEEAKKEPRLQFAVRPALQFLSSNSAVVTWESSSSGAAEVAFWEKGGEVQVIRSEKSAGEHAVLLKGLKPGSVYHYRIGREADGEKQFSAPFELTTGTNFTRPSVAVGEEISENVVKAAADVLKRVEIRKGYGLVYGVAYREFVLELVRTSELNIALVVANAKEQAAARQYFYGKGAHGARVFVLAEDDEEGDLPISGMVNVLIARDELPREELERLLVPGRGKAYFFATKRLVDLPKLEGSGDWTHQYGDASNSAASQEQLSGATKTGDFALAWVGRPGADFGIDRNPRMPAPLSAGGRLFHQGMNRLVALDAQNGAVLWGLEVPDLRRVNVPRDCSNWCADDEHLFVAVKERAWMLDAETGRRVRTFAVSGSDSEGGEFDWSYIAREKEMLVGTKVMAESSFTDFWTSKHWYDGKKGEVAEKVCSDSIFGYALTEGVEPTNKPTWTYQEGLVVNATITVQDGLVIFLEARNPAVVDGAKRRLSGEEFWKGQYLVALDVETGTKAWEHPVDIEDGVVSLYMQASAGRVLLTASNTQYHLYTFEAKSGKPLWNKSIPWPSADHSGHFQHPVMMDGMVYLEPNGIDMKTGEIVTSKVGRREGCHTYVGVGGALLYRGKSRMVSLWDKESETVSSWTRLRPSCWLNTIPASGMLLIPEGGGGCSCGGWMETSLGFVPRSRVGELGKETK